ncbi:MAG: hypothetical protein OHK0029_25760 [Armatimonadaceae bacterium]
MLRANAADQKVLDRFRLFCHLEPRLKNFYHEVQNLTDDTSSESFCVYILWHGSEGEKGLKHRLKRLVGLQAGHPEPTPDALGIDALFNRQSVEFRRFSAEDKRAMRR